MWDTFPRPHMGGVSFMRHARNLFVVVFAAFLTTITLSSTVLAADAKWENGKLVYDERTYEPAGTASEQIAKQIGIPAGAEYYENIDEEVKPNISRILYFPEDVNKEDANNAQYVESKLEGAGTEGTTYTNIRGPTGVTVDQASFESGGTAEETSCVVDGVGFIICPIMNLLAQAMDRVYDVLITFLNVKPLSADSDNALYKAWQIMLSLANVLFIIGFLVIVYSYVTNQGVSQYNLRNIIPRMIIAAILINASYFICALAVDASNVVGASLQDVFNGIRNEVVQNGVTSEQAWTSWQSITILILSGGTVGAAGLAALGVYGVAALHLLMPMLIGSVVAVLVAVVVLAVRQALITILIILAPIAFAAFILPSTQKYFDKWKDVFSTMLIMYPMFAILFGGSQLAATLIAQNATNILIIMLAMFVQVAPLVLTPFLIKFSGSLLGRIAGMVNDPTKGLGDRAKNWSKDRADTAKDRRLSQENKGWRRTPGLAFAQKLDTNKRNREKDRKRYQAIRNATYAEQSRQKDIELKRAEEREAAANNRTAAAFEAQKITNATARKEAVQNKMADMAAHNQKARAENYLTELESVEGASQHARNGDRVAAAFGDSMHALAQDHLVQESRKSFAESEHRVEYANNMVNDQALKAAAAGIAGEAGEKLATARATQVIREDFGKGVAAQTELLKHFSDGLNSAALKNLALGGTAQGHDSSGREYTFDASSIGGELHEAAVAKFLKETNYEGASDIMRAASDNREQWRSLHGTIKDAIISTHMSKTPFWSGQALDRIDQGLADSNGGYERMIVDYINKGKFSPEKLAGADAVALEDMIGVMQAYHDGTLPPGVGLNAADRNLLGRRIENLIEAADETLADPQIMSTISEINRERLLAMKNFNRFR